nr:HAMP domain-containing sensor histidine kinase [Tenuifilaceae bacterium]
KEIELLKKNEEIQSLTILRQRNLIFLWIAIFILLVAVIGTIYYNLLSKKKVNALLSEKNEELKEANVKLLKSEENLKELNTAKDKFFSIIAHDLKNPFNTLLEISELLSANIHSYTKDEIQERSQIIHDSTLSLYKLLDNLLNWSRSQLDSIVYQPELFPLLPEVNQEIKLIETFSDRKNVKISVRIADHIMVFADKHVIGIVLRNLINNAVKFSHIDGKVMVSADEKGDMVEVAVTDNGVGMDREELDKLFKLDQSFTTKGTANETGTGLGLILCKEFIEKNGGKIWVSSTKEKGSTFFFTLRTDRWA